MLCWCSVASSRVFLKGCIMLLLCRVCPSLYCSHLNLVVENGMGLTMYSQLFLYWKPEMAELAQPWAGLAACKEHLCTEFLLEIMKLTSDLCLELQERRRVLCCSLWGQDIKAYICYVLISLKICDHKRSLLIFQIQ